MAFSPAITTARKLGVDLNTLEVFVAVCETGSMTLAAQRLGLTQSAVSHAVAQLERRMETPLLDRRLRPLTTTAAGQFLRESAERILGDACALASAIRLESRTALPHLRIGLIDSLATPFVPHLINDIRDRVRSFSIATGFNEDLRREFLCRDLDLFIATDPIEDVHGLERHEILHEMFVVLVPHGTPPFPDDASFRRYAETVPFIRSGTRSDLARRIERQLRRMRLDPPHVFAFDTIESTVGMVAEGLGWSILTPICILKCLSLVAALDIRPFPGPSFGRTIVLVARSGEFAALPARIARQSRSIVARAYLPNILRLAPWMRGMIRLAG